MIEAKVVFDGGKILSNGYTIAIVDGYWEILEINESYDNLEGAIKASLEN